MANRGVGNLQPPDEWRDQARRNIARLMAAPGVDMTTALQALENTDLARAIAHMKEPGEVLALLTKAAEIKDEEDRANAWGEKDWAAKMDRVEPSASQDTPHWAPVVEFVAGGVDQRNFVNATNNRRRREEDKSKKDSFRKDGMVIYASAFTRGGQHSVILWRAKQRGSDRRRYQSALDVAWRASHQSDRP